MPRPARSRSWGASARSRSRRRSPSRGCGADTRSPAGAPAPTYSEPIATRKAFGETLRWFAGERDGLVVLDGEVGNSTYTEDVEAVAPDRFVQMYIAEQTMIGAQTGLHALGKIAFAATFGAFLTRAYDQIRMAAIGRADLRLCGSHAGVSIGEDGPSQMALEDLAALRAIHGSTVLYPADGTATVSLVTAMADLHGISYVRTTREATAVLYGPDEDFPVGGSKTLGEGDDVAIVGAGITVHESLRAADLLAADGIAARIIDCYSVKPIDAAALRQRRGRDRVARRGRGSPDRGGPRRRGARRARRRRPRVRAGDQARRDGHARFRCTRGAPCLGGDRRRSDRADGPHGARSGLTVAR